MKILKGLNKTIETISGIPVADMVKDQTMSFKSALVSICEMHKPSQLGTGEALRAFDLGIRIQNAKEEIELEEKDIEFLKNIVDKSNIFFSVVIGRLSHYLTEVEDLPKVETKKK